MGPKGEGPVDRSPDPRMVHVWAIKVNSIPLMFWLILAVVWTLVGDVRTLAAMAALLLSAALIVAIGYFWASLYRGFYRWRLEADELRVWRGILFRRRATIPYMRVQNVNVIRGPLLLLFGLSNVEVETAGQRGITYGFYPSEGYLSGLRDGESTADAIVERVKREKAREGL